MHSKESTLTYIGHSYVAAEPASSQQVKVSNQQKTCIQVDLPIIMQSMNAEGHFIFAFASTIFAKKIALTPILAKGDWWHIITGGLITCLLPDIDHPKSLLGQRLAWLSTPIARLCGHRGFTHSLLASIASIILFTLPPQRFIPIDALHAMIIGYLSHILADMLTPTGVPLLWPCHWRFRLPIVSPANNNQLERLLCIASLIFALQHKPIEDTSIMLQYFATAIVPKRTMAVAKYCLVLDN